MHKIRPLTRTRVIKRAKSMTCTDSARTRWDVIDKRDHALSIAPSRDRAIDAHPLTHSHTHIHIPTYRKTRRTPVLTDRYCTYMIAESSMNGHHQGSRRPDGRYSYSVSCKIHHSRRDSPQFAPRFIKSSPARSLSTCARW